MARRGKSAHGRKEREAGILNSTGQERKRVCKGNWGAQRICKGGKRKRRQVGSEQDGGKNHKHHHSKRLYKSGSAVNRKHILGGKTKPQRKGTKMGVKERGRTRETKKKSFVMLDHSGETVGFHSIVT